MKFLVTGSLKKKKGPRLLISFVAVYFLLYLGLRFFLGNNGGVLDGNYQSPSGLTLVLEEMHEDFFYFGLIVLFAGSVLREMFERKIRFVLLYILFAAGLYLPVVTLLVFLYPAWLAVFQAGFLFSLAWIFLVQLVILFRMNVE